MQLSEAVKLTPPKILLYGPAGTWKTTFSTTWGSQSQIIDIDKGLLSALKVQDKWSAERAKIDVVPCYDVNPVAPSAFEKAKAEIFKISELCANKQYKYKVLIVDSLSSLGEHAMRMILRNSNKINAQGKIVEITQREWGLAINELENVLTVLRSLPVAVVVVAHELTEQVDNATRIKIWALGAKLPDKLPTYFDEIWYSRVTGVAPNRRMVLQTAHTGSILCRTRGCLKDLWESEQGLQEVLKQLGYQ